MCTSTDRIKPFVLLLTVGLNSAELHAGETALTVSLGSFDVSNSGTAMAQLEYRFSTDWSGFRPAAGLLVSADSAVYLYAGIAYPFSFNKKWSITPSLAGGYYSRGADRDLGLDFEFYSQLRLDYQIANNARIGVGIGHISNAGIGDKNPGAETAYLSYSFDF